MEFPGKFKKYSKIITIFRKKPFVDNLYPLLQNKFKNSDDEVFWFRNTPLQNSVKIKGT